MAKTVQMNVRIEVDLKHKTEHVLEKLGLSTTQAVTLFFKQINLHKGLPFDVSVPNAESREAIEDALTGRNLHKAKSGNRDAAKPKTRQRYGKLGTSRHSHFAK